MQQTFYIIDGHAQIFRAYYAPFRPLSSPTGEPTKATYVFVQLLLNLIDQQKPDYLVMVVDSGKKDVFRSQIYPQYKTNRSAPPEDFKPQEERILRMVADAGIPVIAIPGYEADDIMATLACRLAESDFKVVLVSKDKDLRQLVNDKVVMYDPQGGGKTTTAADIERECGYPPAKAIEVQTLMGDSIDNIPGVPGVGEKTAAKLIQKYGSVEEVVRHADELTPKLRENLLASAEVLNISRQLVTLRCDVPLDIDLQTCRFEGVSNEGLRKHFIELGFTNLLKRVGGEEAPAPAPVARPDDAFATDLFGTPQETPAQTKKQEEASQLKTTADCDYRLVNTPKLLEAFVAELQQQKEFAFDTETDDLGAMCSNIVGMSFSWREGTGYYLPVVGPAGAEVLPLDLVLERIKPILEDPAIAKFGHNHKYDALVMRKLGVRVRGLKMDSMIAAFVLDSSRDSFGIDRLTAQLLGIRKIATAELIGSGRRQISMKQVELPLITRYAAEDADICLRLCHLFAKQLADQPQLAKLHDELETPLVDVLTTMEFNGVCVDPSVLREQSAVLAEKVEKLRERMIELAGVSFNPDSPRQLAEVLFDRMHLPVLKKNKTGPSTDVEVLEKLAIDHELPRVALEHRTLVKLKNTYLDTLEQFINSGTRRIHASFSQIGAETGRLSCNEPNLQNIPIRTDEGRAIRLAFVPQDRQRDVLLTADYSQIELRVLAHLTGEPALIAAFEADQDIHTAVAAQVFGVEPDQVTREQRARAKVINFGIIYGISAFGLARRIEGLDRNSAQQLIDAYNARFPSIQKFMKACVQQAREHGYVETIMHRRRYLPQVHAPIVAQRKAAERMAINSVVQGSAADLIKMAMVNIQRRIESEDRPLRMLLQVHDELVFEVPRDQVEQQAQFVREEMEGAVKLRVPLRVSVGWGANWQEGK